MLQRTAKEGREKSHQASIKPFLLEKNKAKCPASSGNTPLLQAKDQKPQTTTVPKLCRQTVNCKADDPRTKIRSYQRIHVTTADPRRRNERMTLNLIHSINSHPVACAKPFMKRI